MGGVRTVILAWAVGLLAAAVGCETFTQDLNSLGSAIMPVSPEQAARWMVDPNDPDNRRKGTVLISNSPFGGAEAYVTWYRDRIAVEANALVRAALVTALGRWGEPSDAPVIAARLADDNLYVRWEAAKALQRIHNPAVVPDLLRVMRNDDEDTDVRTAAAVALGQYPQDRVFQVLVAALDAPQLSINEAARKSLGTLTGESLGLDPEAWLAWYNGAAAPFAGQQEYLFPTYQRDETLLEKLAFWSKKSYEQPAPPAGLKPPPRETYQSSDEAPSDETGG